MYPLLTIRSLGVSTRIKAGTQLFEQGTEITNVYFIESGELELTSVSSEGREVIIQRLGCGEFVPLSGLVEHGLYATDCSVVRHCDLIAICASRLNEEVKKSPELAYYLLQLSVRELHRRTIEFEDMALLSVGARLCKWLIKRINENSSLQRGSTLEFNESERIIGLSLGGISRESVSRHLAALKNIGVIARDGRTIRVLDPLRLRAFAAGLIPISEDHKQGGASPNWSEVA